MEPIRRNNPSNKTLQGAIGTSLVVQWLTLRAPNAWGLGSTLDQGTRSHMPQLKNSGASTKTEDPTYNS